MYRQKSQLATSSTHSLSAMYVLTGIHKLETTVDSCLDRVATDPGHSPDSCVVARVRGQAWQCGGGERVGREAGVSQDMFADSEGIEEEDVREGAGEREEEEELEEGVLVQLPLNYQLTGPAVWQERTLMSPFNARPLLIAQIKESRETVQTFFRSYMDPEVHLVTHYSSPPSWEGGQYCLWSPRGRQVVREEECSRVKVLGKTTLKNPLRLKNKSSVEEMEEKRQEEEEEENMSRKRKRPDPVIVLPQTEVERRRQAYLWMVSRGTLEGVRVDHSAVSKLKMFDSLIGKK